MSQCPKHPKYTGKRRPTVYCYDCGQIYEKSTGRYFDIFLRKKPKIGDRIEKTDFRVTDYRPGCVTGADGKTSKGWLVFVEQIKTGES